MKSSDILDFFFLSAIWGASFLFMRVATPEFGPFALIGIRAGLAALCLLPLVWMQGGLRGLRAHVRELAVIGVANSFVPFTLLAYASLSLTAGFASLLNATTPLWAALLGVIWLKASLTRRQWIGLALGALGMLVLTWGQVDFKPGGSGLAIIAGLIATLAYGFSSHYTKRKLSNLPPMAVAAGSQAAGGLMILPFAIAFWPSAMPSAKAWGAAILLSVLATAIALVIYFRLIARLGGQKASSVTFLIPVFAALWGWALLDEGVTTPMWIGGGIVLLGTALTLGLIRPKTPPKTL